MSILNDYYENFVSEWDKETWMQEHGEWESARWDERREARDEARETFAAMLREAADEAAAGESVDLDFLATLHEKYVAAERGCEGEVTPENDYIAEGLIDPDEVSDDPGVAVYSGDWQGWDCTEGESVHLAFVDGALRVVHNWWRNAYGQRHDRDLWRVAGCTSRACNIAEMLDAVRWRACETLVAQLVEQDASLARRVRDAAPDGSDVAKILDAALPAEPAEADEAAANG
jgi:hypothetical protein